MTTRPTLPEIFLVALRLGCTSFGGPVAHLAFFRKEYVEKRRWLDDAEFADLVALCQFLPGPASSQTGFGIGYGQRGLAGGLAAWFGFTLPSALLMTGFALGVASLGNLEGAGWLQGLKIAAVAVVTQAVLSMWRNLCPDVPRSFLAGICAGLVLLLPTPWIQLGVMALGAAAGRWFLPSVAGNPPAGPAHPDQKPAAPSTGNLCLILFFVLLVGLPVAARLMHLDALSVFDKFYRTGALVFGGGHVVLPLLEKEVVAPGWVTHDQFLAGYGAVQAMPGPLFTLSVYLGTVLRPGGGWSGGLVALIAIFLPALLLVAGALPHWQGLRRRPAVQQVMRGTNAAVVGLLLAALIGPVITHTLTGGNSLALAAAAFLILQSGRVPVWAVVGISALAGWLWL